MERQVSCEDLSFPGGCDLDPAGAQPGLVPGCAIACQVDSVLADHRLIALRKCIW
jgi:hypothetical protein